jgi:predicted permease
VARKLTFTDAVKQLRHAMAGSALLNALLVVIELSFDSPSKDQTIIARVVRFFGAPAGALTEIILGYRHPDSDVIVVLLLSSFAVYAAIIWALLMALPLRKTSQEHVVAGLNIGSPPA